MYMVGIKQNIQKKKKNKGYVLSIYCSPRTLKTSRDFRLPLPQTNRPKKKKNAIILTVSGGVLLTAASQSVCLSVSKRRKQNPGMCSTKHNMNCGKCSERPKGEASRNSSHPPRGSTLHKSLSLPIKTATASQAHRAEYKKRRDFKYTNPILAFLFFVCLFCYSSKQAANLCLNVCLCVKNK